MVDRKTRIGIAGAGNVGRSVAQELLDNGHKVLLIEKEWRKYEPDTVPGADWQGFTDGPRCDAANDPAVAILRTARSRVIICQVGSAGGLYYKGVAPEGHKHIDFPTQQGKYFIARSGSYEYFVTPSGLVIRDGGNTIADEPATAYWSR